MKNLNLLFLFLLSAIISNAQPVEEWAMHYNNPLSNGTDVFLDMVVDANGNTYVCGYSDGTSVDIVVAKYSLDTTAIWVYRYDGVAQGEDKAVSIALTSNNDVVVTGHSEGQTTGWDIITILINGNTGVALSNWPQFIDGSAHGEDWGNDVAVRQSDNLIAVCGAKKENYLRKALRTYETDGSINWDGLQWNSDNFDTYNLLCGFFNSGKLFVVDQQEGGSADTISFYYVLNGDNGGFYNGTHGHEMGYLNPYSYDQNLARKFAINGSKAYVAVDYRDDSSPYEDYYAVYEIDEGSLNPGSISIDPMLVQPYSQPLGTVTGIKVNSSKIYISGYEDVNSLSGVNWNGFVAVFNKTTGALIWDENYGGAQADKFFDIAIDNLSNANIYVTGYSTPSSDRDITTVKYGPNGGAPAWERFYDGTANGLDETYRIELFNCSYIVAGQSNETGTNEDGIVIKYCDASIPDAGQDPSYCTGGNTTIGSPSVGGNTYLWTPATGLSSDTAANPTVSLTNLTSCPVDHEYILKVTNACGCSSYDTVIVTVNPKPTVSISASTPTTICENEPPIIITPTIDIGCASSATYSWIKNGTPPAVDNTASPYVVNLPSETGTYTLTVTNNYGCSTVSNTTPLLTVNPLPVGSANPSAPSVCSGSATNIALSSTISGTTFTWTSTGGGTPCSTGCGNSIQQTLTGSGTVTYTVTPTVTSTGCVGQPYTVVVTVHPLPAQPTITADGALTFCNGGSVTLTSSSGSSYLWSPGGATTDFINATASGAYTVTISDINGCQNTSNSTQVTVNQNPVANAGLDKTFCVGFSDILGGNPTATGGLQPYDYLWNNSSYLNDSTQANPTLINTLPINTYPFSITVTDANNCVGTDQVTVTVVSELTANAGQDVSICEGESTTLTGTGGTNYSWSPTSTLSSSNTATTVASPSDTTTYQLIISANGCAADTAWVTVSVLPVPATSFSFDDSQQPEISFTDLSLNAVEWAWDFGDGTTSSDQNPTHTYSNNDTYDVELCVTSPDGCTDCFTQQVMISVGISELEGIIFSVYPNPSDNYFTIETQIDKGIYLLQDITGKQLMQGNISATKFNIDISALSKGIYVISIYNEEHEAHRKIIKE